MIRKAFVCLSLLVSCRGCPPPSQGSSAVVTNRSATPTTVYVSFGANSAIGPNDWSFCGDSGGCSFSLASKASQSLPSFGKALNATVSFDAQPGCSVTLAEFNFNIPGWSQDTANISLVNGWSNVVEIDMSDGMKLGPAFGDASNADAMGVYPVACDICVARSQPPCGFDASGCTESGSCGCKSGTQYNPTPPCQYSFAPGETVTIALTSH